MASGRYLVKQYSVPAESPEQEKLIMKTRDIMSSPLIWLKSEEGDFWILLSEILLSCVVW